MGEVKRSKHLIDPEIRGIIDEMGSMGLTSENYLEVREQLKAFFSSDVRERYDVEIEEVWIDNLFDDSKVRLVITKPQNQAEQLNPFIYSMHGGGMIVGGPELDNETHAFLAHHYHFIGVSVDYRLAPEFSQPAQLHDCYSGIKWCIDHAKELNIDTGKVAVAGVSAGSALAGGLVLFIRDRQEFNIHHLRLSVPMLDDRTAIKEAHPFNGEYFFNQAINYFGWKSVLKQEPGTEGISEYYSPARAKTFKGLPSTYLCVGSIELFADETLDFAKQLMYDGVPVELHLYPGYHHQGLSVPEAYHAKRENENNLNALLRALNIKE
ncbi:alpha/beta hydrolase fold domain-containing protein [Chengkuizengella sediminis]|uniref:alpha/beta hydrolase fold domain-containing protein n=1 Tax=Chengkuizengella sediminis TaxID=1885917 RepID=UPI00138970F5|nr:alpha/beta hydrolase [Chengkuizengella sediminis]NDI36906.1 alpha/beta hydrolase [Chengkuizengella sediminis]